MVRSTFTRLRTPAEGLEATNFPREKSSRIALPFTKAPVPGSNVGCTSRHGTFVGRRTRCAVEACPSSLIVFATSHAALFGLVLSGPAGHVRSGAEPPRYI